MMEPYGEFREELRKLVNRYSVERDSATPDFILSEYLTKCLEAFDTACIARDLFFDGM